MSWRLQTSGRSNKCNALQSIIQQLYSSLADGSSVRSWLSLALLANSSGHIQLFYIASKWLADELFYEMIRRLAVLKALISEKRTDRNWKASFIYYSFSSLIASFWKTSEQRTPTSLNIFHYSFSICWHLSKCRRKCNHV